jgi:hypothetical protein
VAVERYPEAAIGEISRRRFLGDAMINGLPRGLALDES